MNHLEYLKVALHFYSVACVLVVIMNHFKIRNKDDGGCKLRIYWGMRLLCLLALVPFCYFFVWPWYKMTYELNSLNWWQTKEESWYGNASIFCAASVWILWAYSWIFEILFSILAFCVGFLVVMLVVSCGKVRNLFDLLKPISNYL